MCFLIQDKHAVQCHCFNNMENLSYGNKSTCTEKCNKYVCGSPVTDDVSVYKRLDAEPGM